MRLDRALQTRGPIVVAAVQLVHDRHPGRNLPEGREALGVEVRRVVPEVDEDLRRPRVRPGVRVLDDGAQGLSTTFVASRALNIR